MTGKLGLLQFMGFKESDTTERMNNNSNNKVTITWSRDKPFLLYLFQIPDPQNL